MNPRVSVVMPMYNVERYVGEAIESLLQQSFQDFELIIVDDASTDGSVEVAAGYRDERITLLRNGDNLGPGPTRNHGVAHASGEYIALMDADDRCRHDRLEVEVRFLDRHPDIAAVSAWYSTIDENGSSLEHCHRPETDPEVIRARLPFQNPVASGAAMVRTGTLSSLAGYRPLFGPEDYDLWLRMTDERASIAIIPEYLYTYRIHGASITGRGPAMQAALTYLARMSAWRRRRGFQDPLAGASRDAITAMARQVLSGRGPWGREHRAWQHWDQALRLRQEGHLVGAAGEALLALGRCPRYPPLWHELRDGLAQRVTGHRQS